MKYSQLSSFLIGSSLVFLTSTLPLIYDTSMGEYFLTMIMYTQSISLFLGNELAAFLIIVKRVDILVPLVLMRLLLLIPIFTYDFYSHIDKFNIFIVLLVATFCFSGSYLNSCNYVIVSSVPSTDKPILVSSVNYFLYLGYFSGLFSSILFQTI